MQGMEYLLSLLNRGRRRRCLAMDKRVENMDYDKTINGIAELKIADDLDMAIPFSK